MNGTAYFQTLFAYHGWANRRILDAAAGLSPEQFAAPAGLSHGGLRGTLVHLISAEWIWRSRIQEGISPTAMLAEDDFPTMEPLRQRWERETGALAAFLAGLLEEDLTRPVRYTSTRGRPFENQLWQLLTQMANHGTQHRSEAAVLLTGYGRSPGDLDLIVFLREV